MRRMTVWALMALAFLHLAGCGSLEGYVYMPPPSPEPMGAQFWWGSDPTCAPGCPPGSPGWR